MAKVNTTQIAKHLNISRNTVSKALNNSPVVKDETKQRVLKAAMELGYKKSKLSLLAVEEKVLDVCIIVHESEMSSSYWGMILKGAEEFLSSQNYRVVLVIVNKQEEKTLTIPSAITTALPSGIIMIGTYSESYYRKIASLGIALTTIDISVKMNDRADFCDTIIMESQSAVYDITKDLINKGYTDIAFLGNYNFSKTIRDRWNGYLQAHIEGSVPILPKNAVFLKLDYLSEYEDIYKFLKNIKEFPQAIVCANDTIAYRVMSILKDMGKRVPEDIAVSGFDDFIPEFNQESDLTSVTFNVMEMGSLAAMQVINRIKNPEMSFVVIQIESHVIFRGSTFKKIKSYKKSYKK